MYRDADIQAGHKPGCDERLTAIAVVFRSRLETPGGCTASLIQSGTSENVGLKLLEFPAFEENADFEAECL
jgi:hypothetical protein